MGGGHSEAVKIEKQFENFHVFAQNIDCGYMLELPGSLMITPNSTLDYITDPILQVSIKTLFFTLTVPHSLDFCSVYVFCNLSYVIFVKFIQLL